MADDGHGGSGQGDIPVGKGNAAAPDARFFYRAAFQYERPTVKS